MDTATGPSTMLPSYPILGWYLQSCHDHQLIIYQAIHLSFILWNSWCLICSWFSLPLLIVEVGVTIRDLGTLIYQFWFHSCFVFPWLFIFPHGHFLAGPGGRPSSFGWKTKEEVNLRLQADHLFCTPADFGMSGCIHSYHIFVVHVGYGNSIVFLDCLSKISTVIPMLTDPETHHLHWGLLVFRFFNSHSAQRQHHPETCQWPGQNYHQTQDKIEVCAWPAVASIER